MILKNDEAHTIILKHSENKDIIRLRKVNFKTSKESSLITLDLSRLDKKKQNEIRAKYYDLVETLQQYS